MRLAWGKISEVAADKGLYRVDFDDRSDVSRPLPRLSLNTKNNKDESHFDVNEHVVVVMDDNFEDGVILGAIYDTSNLPAVGNKDKRVTTYQDGSFETFDRSTGKKEINVKGELDLTSNKTKVSGALGIELQGSVDFVTRYNPLHAALQTFVAAVNVQLAAAATGIATAGGSYVPVTLTLDISAAKNSDVKTS